MARGQSGWWRDRPDRVEEEAMIEIFGFTIPPVVIYVLVRRVIRFLLKAYELWR